VSDLETRLRALDVEWPATPDLATTVLARLGEAPDAATRVGGEAGPGGAARAGGETGPGGAAWVGGEAVPGAAARVGGETAPPAAAAAPRRRRPRLARRRVLVAYAAAALLALAGATLAASPDARSAVLRWLGLESVEIRRVPLNPGLGRDLHLGPPAPITAATPLPAALGIPDAVYATPLPDGTTATSLLYAGPPRVLVQVFRARVTPFIQKTLAQATHAERLTIDGAPAYWIGGAHGFAYETGNGFAYEQQRLAGRTLLLERAGRLIRVEGEIGKAKAIAIARSVQ